MSDWNRKVEDSIRKEKAEVERRYGIKIGRTEICCSRCGKSSVPGVHSCQDIRFKQLKEAQKHTSPHPSAVFGESLAVAHCGGSFMGSEGHLEGL